jgi:hypothetical protein
MSIWFSSSRPNFWATFDQLAATPKPFRAVSTFLSLGLVCTLVLFGITLSIGNALEPLGIILSNTLSFDHSGNLSKPTFWGLIAVIVFGAVWANAMFWVRDLAMKIGGNVGDNAADCDLVLAARERQVDAQRSEGDNR